MLEGCLAFSFQPVNAPSLHTQNARVVEFRPRARVSRAACPGRPSGGPPEERLDVLHAWLVEDLPGGRVRALAQETQIGRPAAELARQLPAPMLNAHQSWLNGLVEAASGRLAA